MSWTVTGLPAVIIWVGFLVVFSAPVWLAARMVGAEHPTLWRSILALMLGLVGAIVSFALTGLAAFVLAPLSFLLAFRFVLGTSFFGAILLGIVAAAGYAAMIYFIGSGFSVRKESVKPSLVSCQPGCDSLPRGFEIKPAGDNLSREDPERAENKGRMQAPARYEIVRAERQYQ
jgi:hypothetical protein